MYYKTVWFSHLSSTNRFCKQYQERLPDGFVAVTEDQSDGKGSKGRSWAFPPGKALALSILHLSPPRPYLSTLPLIAGLSAVQALRRLDIDRLSLKWPNDLLLNGKKIAGILCESSLSPKQDFIICGIGINRMQTKQELLKNLLPYAGSIYSETGQALSPHLLLNILLEEYNKIYTIWSKEGMAPFIDRYRACCQTIGQEVSVMVEGTKRMGKALDISPDGRLLCEMGGNQTLFCAEEVSVRRQDGRYC